MSNISARRIFAPRLFASVPDRPRPAVAIGLYRGHKLALARRVSGSRSGFSLLEVLIATAVTLLMMLGLAQIFRVLGESMSQGRVGLELNNRLRGVIHRIRTDLDNVTVDPHPPIAVGSGQGYLKYYEGPAADYTFANIPLLSRFGDMDDIFMATVKAKDTWFTGKVPRFIAEKRAPANVAELTDTVTIASQFAEVVIFAQPLVAQGRPPGYTGIEPRPDRDPSFLASHPNFYEDQNGDGVPDAFRLHYRVLLIRPDLNLPTGFLPNKPADNIMVAHRPMINSQNLETPECDMSQIFQYCDLSVRRHDHTVSPSAVAANTLEDLANPANRFAHVRYLLGTNGNTRVETMPILALTEVLNHQWDTTPSGPLPFAGFLHPAYALRGDRTGEDVLATDLLAFDIRAFDSSAPILTYDNITLRPGDPGFGPIVTGGGTFQLAANGEFVDLDWAGKLKRGFPSINPPISPIVKIMNFVSATEFSGLDASAAPTTSLLRSGLVKFAAGTSSRPIFQPSFDTFTDSYEKDGSLHAELNVSRGLVQFSAINPNNPMLPSEIPPLLSQTPPLRSDAWRIQGTILSMDAGSDGIDNAGSNPGVDDPSERETSPPFPVELRGLQISVRLEDGSKKQFKQMSTIKEFVTH